MVLNMTSAIYGDDSLVADATKWKIFLSIPALKDRAKFIPTLRVESNQ
jgi:hypothetical protein